MQALWKRAATSFILIAASVGCAPPEDVDSPKLALIDQVAAAVLARQPRIVIVSESHSVPSTRYVAACIVEAIARRRSVTHFGAETFSENGLLTLDASGRPDPAGPYVHHPHFDDLIDTAGRAGARFFGYDATPEEAFPSPEALEMVGLSPSRIVARDWIAAQIALAALGDDPTSLAVIHVGGSHGMRHVEETSQGDYLLLGGALVRLGETRLSSVLQLSTEHRLRRVACGPDPFWEADFQTGEMNCAFAPVERPHDVRIVGAQLAVNERGYVTEPLDGCTVRRPIAPTPPSDLAAPFRLEIRQRDTLGRWRLTWSGGFIAGETRPLVLDLDETGLTWIGADHTGETRTVFERVSLDGL